MATHSSTLAWKIPWMEEPGGLRSMGSIRVGQDSVTSLSLFTFLHWRRQWQPTPVLLPGESPGTGEPCGLPSVGLQSRTRLKWLSSSTLFNPSLLIVYIQDQILAKYTLYLFLFLFHNILVSEQTKKRELCSVKCYTFDFSMCKPCCY